MTEPANGRVPARRLLNTCLLLVLCAAGLTAALADEPAPPQLPPADAGQQQPQAQPATPAPPTTSQQTPPAAATSQPDSTQPPPTGNQAGSRQARLIGTASLSRRVPVVGATVLVSPEAGPPALYLTSTDDRGIFRLDNVPEGDYRIELRRSDLIPIVKDSVSIRPQFRAFVEVTMQKGDPAHPVQAGQPDPAASAQGGSGSGGSGPVSVDGKVAGRDGGPLNEARVRMVHAEAMSDPRMTITGADGGFSFAGLPAGPWRIEVIGVGYMPLRVALPLQGNTRLVAALVPQPTSYSPQPLDLIPPEEPIPPPGTPAARTLDQAAAQAREQKPEDAPPPAPSAPGM